jgi:hypothetical protein
MVALDTLRIRVSRSVLGDFAPTAFRQIEETDGRTGEVRSVRKLSPRVIRETCGLGAVEIGEELATVEVSGKILGGAYPQGINLETVERVTDAINRTGILSVDGQRFIDEAEVLRCDVCANLPVADVPQSLNNLRLIALNERYHPRPYERTGIVFTREAKSVRERLTFYDKYGELVRLNRKWIEAGMIDAEPFKGMLRAETNVSKFRDIRNLFGIEEPRLLTAVLSSGENPLLKVFESVSNHRLVRASENGFSELCAIKGGAASVRNRLGWIRIFELCGWEWPVIMVWVKAKYQGKSKPVRMVAQARREYEREMRERGRLDAGINRLEEIRNLLRAAA